MTVAEDVRITQANVIRDDAQTGDIVWISRAEINHNAQTRDNVTIQDSVVHDRCLICGDARIVYDSEVIAVRGLTRESDQLLQIYERVAVSNSRAVHQAQVYGDVTINYVSTKHRAGVFDFTWIGGNEGDNIWICDCAKVYGHVRVIARTDEDAIPTPRYSSQVAEHTMVEGNYVLEHHVLVRGYA